jgi:hypothetical protein
MGSLVEELARREAAARAEAGWLRARVEELTAELAGAQEQATRLAITREEVTRVLEEPPAADVALRDGARAGRPRPASPIGAVTVPPWQEGAGVPVLPRAYQDLVRHEAHCYIACLAGKEWRRCLWVQWLTGGRKTKWENSMPGNRWPCPGVRNGASRDPRDKVKAGLPEAQSPEGEMVHPPERRMQPAPVPAGG